MGHGFFDSHDNGQTSKTERSARAGTRAGDRSAKGAPHPDSAAAGTGDTTGKGAADAASARAQGGPSASGEPALGDDAHARPQSVL